jgi:hypothetical protein
MNPTRTFLSLFLLLCPSVLFAQAVSVAEATGLVLDPSGSAVAGATVKMVETERQVSHAATTDATGRYTIPNLPVGSYRLEASATGFKTYVQTGIELQVNNHVQLNINFQVGAIAEKVEVSAGANLVETQQNAISQVIDQKRIVDLPLNGRQPTQLILISGAAVVAPGGDMSGSKNYASSTTISIAGGQANGTNYILDGGDNLDTFSNVNLPFPFPDALQEFSVETNALPARNGTQPGGVVNIVTKSGANSFHGDLFEFLRNGNVNARNFFAPTHDSLKRNQFGGTLGGKIIRDKLFFFAGYQGTRNRSNPPQSTATVPTAAALSGDFSGLESAGCQSNHQVRTIKNPYNGTPFPGGQVPTSLFDPAAVKLVNYLPQSSNVCGTTTFGIPTTGDENQEVVRIDYARSAKHNIFGRYFITDYQNPGNWNPKDILVTSTAGNLERAQSVTLGDTYTFNPNTVNSFHATFTRRRDNRGPNSQDINVNTLGVNIFTNVPDDLRITVGSGSSGFAIGCGTCSPGHFNVNTFQEADDIDVIRGKHQMAFGVDVIRTQNNILSGYLQNGNFGFSGQATGDPLLDFLTGSLSTFQQSRPQLVSLRATILGAYAQDSIHLTPHLVLNAGLRWEPMLFPHDLYHRGSTFSLAAFLAGTHSQVYTNAPAGSLYYGDPGVSANFTSNRFTNFSPRLGLVWDPKGDGKQTIRVGAAIMYDSAEIYLSQHLASNPPVVNELDFTISAPGGFSNPWTTGYNYPGGNPFPGVTPPSANTPFPAQGLYTVLPQNLHTTNLAQWNASYQRQFGNNWVATVTYLGNHTNHLYSAQELNPGIYTPGETSVTYKNRLLYKLNPSQGQYYGDVSILDDGATASYDAMLASLQHRFSKGFTLLTNYTWSHCTSTYDFTTDLNGTGFLNPYNLAMDKGDCNFDIRQIFNLSVVATSSTKGSSMLAKVLRNWQVAPLIRTQTGAPLNITTGKDNSLAGTNTITNFDRPNQVLPNIYNASWGPSLQYINPAAFAQNAAGTFGSLGRDAARTPGLLSFDASIDRLFYLTERFHLDVRADAFNVINHTNFSSPSQTGIQIPGISTGVSAALNSTTFGRLTSAGDPRILQFSMKLIF